MMLYYSHNRLFFVCLKNSSQTLCNMKSLSKLFHNAINATFLFVLNSVDLLQKTKSIDVTDVMDISPKTYLFLYIICSVQHN